MLRAARLTGVVTIFLSFFLWVVGRAFTLPLVQPRAVFGMSVVMWLYYVVVVMLIFCMYDVLLMESRSVVRCLMLLLVRSCRDARLPSSFFSRLVLGACRHAVLPPWFCCLVFELFLMRFHY